MKIFFVLNGLAVVFLLYVLAQFWLDGRRLKNPAAIPLPKSRPAQAAKVIVMQAEGAKSASKATKPGALEMSVRQIS